MSRNPLTMPTFVCVHECVCVRACPLSCRSIAAYGRPPPLQPLLSAFSPATVSSRHAITLSNETGMLALEPAASALSPSPSRFSFPPSLPLFAVRSFTLSASLHFIPCSILIGLFSTVAAGWMSVDGRGEIGRQSWCHAVIGTKTASALTLSLFPFSPSQSFSFSVKLSYSFLFSRPLSFFLFFFAPVAPILSSAGPCLPHRLLLPAHSHKATFDFN